MFLHWVRRLLGKRQLGHPDPLERVTARALKSGDPEDPRNPTPLLTLEEFFEGNDEVGSIGCNIEGEPEPSEFYTLLKSIRTRETVSDVRIQITCVDDPGEMWPFSDTVWIMTTEGPSEVQTWFPPRLAPDETWVGFTENVKFEAVMIEDGHQPIAAWFD